MESVYPVLFQIFLGNSLGRTLHIQYNGIAPVFAAAMILVLPLKWMISMAVAAIIHELCHYLAIRATGNHVYELSLTHHGAVMRTTPLSDGEELFCAVSGPLGSFLLFLCYPWTPRLAICACVQGVFNLMPLYPLDGGRVFYILMRKLFPDSVATICRWTQGLLIICIFFAGLYFSVCFQLGPGPLFLSMMFLFRALSEKFLANRGN